MARDRGARTVETGDNDKDASQDEDGIPTLAVNEVIDITDKDCPPLSKM